MFWLAEDGLSTNLKKALLHKIISISGDKSGLTNMYIIISLLRILWMIMKTKLTFSDRDVRQYKEL